MIYIMSLSNILDEKYKNQIDEYINKIKMENPNIINIYGGRTEQTLEIRQKQHENENNNFKHMKIKQIFNIKSKDKLYQMQLAETYLIKKLKDNFNNKCININQTGGGTINYNPKDINKLYVMYK
jgi:hypothetical protein